MGAPPPPPILRSEFEARVKRLLAEGKPLTMANIDPRLAEWQKRNHIPEWHWIVLGVCAVVIVAALVIAIGL